MMQFLGCVYRWHHFPVVTILKVTVEMLLTTIQLTYNVSFQSTSVCHHFVIIKEAVVWNLFIGQWNADFEGHEKPGIHLLNFYSTNYRSSYIYRFKHTANGCARLATPVPVPSLQLSNYEHGQYRDGWLTVCEHHMMLIFAKKTSPISLQASGSVFL
jgi:hypothetical protein